MLLEMLLALKKSLSDVIAQLQLDRIGTQDEGSSEIGFPRLKNRPQIQKQDIVFTNGQIGRILVIRGQRVAPGANNAFVPVRGNSKHLLREIVDFLIQLAFQHICANESPGLNRLEEFIRLLLSLLQRSRARRLR
jgi:hypothetical protein